MFGRSLFDDDPFFADHRNAMNSMMRGFGGGFESGFEAIEDGRGGNRRGDDRRRGQQQRQQQQQMMMANPFEQMHQQMNSMMQGMMNMRLPDMNGRGGNDAHSYSHSSVYSYTSDGQGPPKVFQAAREERHGPGGVKETKKAVKDSESGMQKMAVGHHLGDRGHVIERSHNVRSGEREEKQDFIGLAEHDGPTFNEEWKQATRGGGNGRHQQYQQRQVDDRSHRRHGDERRERRSHQRALPESNGAESPRNQMLK